MKAVFQSFLGILAAGALLSFLKSGQAGTGSAKVGSFISGGFN